MLYEIDDSLNKKLGAVGPCLMSVNWAQVLKKCRPEIHKKIIDTRGKYEELRRLIVEARNAIPKINFEAYRNALPVASRSFVDQMEASVKSFMIKKTDTAPLLQSLDAEKATKV